MGLPFINQREKRENLVVLVSLQHLFMLQFRFSIWYVSRNDYYIRFWIQNPFQFAFICRISKQSDKIFVCNSFVYIWRLLDILTPAPALNWITGQLTVSGTWVKSVKYCFSGIGIDWQSVKSCCCSPHNHGDLQNIFML